MISEYGVRLADRLAFDPALARTVRREVEDHLREAAAAVPTDDVVDAERRAVTAFGDVQVLAAQFALVSLEQHTKRAGAVIRGEIARAFVVMMARVAGYAAMAMALRDDLRAVSGLVVTIDRHAFWLSLIAGIGGWIYISSRRSPAGFDPTYRAQLGRFVVLCGTAVGALVVSVVSVGVLTVVRLSGAGISATALIPILTMAAEIAGAGLVLRHLHRTRLRTTATAGLHGT